MVKYTVTANRGGVYQTLYAGNDEQQVAAVVAKAVTLTADRLRELGDYIYKAWVKEASESADFPAPSHSWRDVDYRKDYIRGIQRPEVREGSLIMGLRTSDALRVELGWAPPNTSHMEDGIGKYNGQLHDLRPWLFKFGTVHTKMSKGPRQGERYRNLRFIGPNMTKQIARVMPFLERSYKEAMSEGGKDVSERMLKKQRVKMQAVMRNLYRQSVREYPGDGDDEDFDSGTGMYRAAGLGKKINYLKKNELHELPPAAPHHVTWLYGKSKPNATSAVNDHKWFVHHRQRTVVKHMEDNKTIWKTFRTIWENPALQPESFLTRGIKPARLISGPKAPITVKLRQGLKLLLLGQKLV